MAMRNMKLIGEYLFIIIYNVLNLTNYNLFSSNINDIDEVHEVQAFLNAQM
jgi:hypothetical protein